MSNTYNTIKDEHGTWHVYPGGLRVLIEPSQKWLDEHPEPEPIPEPEPEPTIWDELAKAYQEGVENA